MERSFFAIFEELDDPRDDKGKIYPLIDIIILAIYGVLIGFTDFSNMSYYLKKREIELKEAFNFAKGVPSHDVFSDVFSAINVEKFMNLFVEWTKQLAYAKTDKHIAIDGKAVRAATEKAKKGSIPYVVSAFMCGCGLSIGQKKIEDKTNEITEIPNLLDLIDITDCFVTIDAIGTQTVIMEKIISKGGHFCLQLKRNQKTAFDDVSLFFNDLEINNPEEYKQLDSFSEKQKNHGRIETREYYVFNNEQEIAKILGPKWKSVKCLGMAKLTRNVNGVKSTDIHFHLLDKPVDAKEYADLARSHWRIENNLHWILDIHFKEDASTARKDNAIANLTLLRKIAFNFSKLDPSLSKKTTKKKMIDYMTDLSLFKRLIYDIIPAID